MSELRVRLNDKMNVSMHGSRGDHWGSRHPPLSIFKGMGFEMVNLCLTHPGLKLNPPH